MRTRRTNPTVNAGSMADIAFLLLIFFLVVTTIAEDKGIPVILPEFYEGPPGPAPKNNVLTIIINADDELLVESKPAQIDKLKDLVISFVQNPTKNNDMPLSTDRAIISLQNDVNTSYEAYVLIYSHIHDAYRAMRNEAAIAYFQEEYLNLSIAQKNEILKQYPLKLSEADPFS